MIGFHQVRRISESPGADFQVNHGNARYLGSMKPFSVSVIGSLLAGDPKEHIGCGIGHGPQKDHSWLFNQPPQKYGFNKGLLR